MSEIESKAAYRKGWAVILHNVIKYLRGIGREKCNQHFKWDELVLSPILIS